MKRRNREQRARMRTIQENHMTKPYQRAMDYLCRNTGLSYRAVHLAYQAQRAVPCFSFTLDNPTIVTREDNSVCKVEITGIMQFGEELLDIELVIDYGEEE